MVTGSASALYTRCLVLPDTADEEPGAVAAGPLAFLLHVSAQLYCMRNATDGYIPRAMIRRLVDWTGVAAVRGDRSAVIEPGEKVYYPVDSMHLASLLVAEGMWVRIGDGFVIQGLLLSNPAQAEFDRVRVQGEIKAVLRREKILENDPELTTLEAAILGVTTVERPKRLDGWARAKAKARERAQADSTGTGTLSLPETGNKETRNDSPESPETSPVPAPGRKRKTTGVTPPPAPPRQGESERKRRRAAHSSKVDALMATTTPSGKVEPTLTPNTFKKSDDPLQRAIGNPRVQSFMDEVKRLDPQLVVTMNPRAASAIKNCTAAPSIIAKAYVDAKYRRWGDPWLWRNMNVWSVIDRLDAYDEAEADRTRSAPVQQIAARRFSGAMVNGYAPGNDEPPD